MSQSLLKLDTMVKRPKITIDDRFYSIISPDELPVFTSHMLAAKGRQIDALMRKDALDDAEGAELKQLVTDIADRIMEPVPVEVREKLSDAQRMSVIEAFTALLLSKKTGTAAALIRGLVPNSTGAKSSPASSAFSAATPPAGSTQSPSR